MNHISTDSGCSSFFLWLPRELFKWILCMCVIWMDECYKTHPNILASGVCSSVGSLVHLLVRDRHSNGPHPVQSARIMVYWHDRLLLAQCNTPDTCLSTRPSSKCIQLLWSPGSFVWLAYKRATSQPGDQQRLATRTKDNVCEWSIPIHSWARLWVSVLSVFIQFLLFLFHKVYSFFIFPFASWSARPSCFPGCSLF